MSCAIASCGIIRTLLVGTLITMIFVNPILQIIIRPLSAFGKTPQALGPTDSIGIFFKVGFPMGTAFALPIMIYHIIAFGCLTASILTSEHDFVDVAGRDCALCRGRQFCLLHASARHVSFCRIFLAKSLARIGVSTVTLVLS